MNLQFPRYLTAAAGSGILLMGGYGCAGTYAAEGAKAGLVGGAVAGAVGTVFFGGNVGSNIAAAAVTSAAAGAAVGATQKKPTTEQQASPPPAESTSGRKSEEELAQRNRALADRIGPDNFEAARLLARCDHKGAILQARKAFAAEPSQERRGYALMIEAVAAEEQGDTATAAAVYPQLVQIDPSRESVVKARNDALSGILKVQQARKDYGLRPACT
jgi:hypothetical protein